LVNALTSLTRYSQKLSITIWIGSRPILKRACMTSMLYNSWSSLMKRTRRSCNETRYPYLTITLTRWIKSYGLSLPKSLNYTLTTLKKPMLRCSSSMVKPMFINRLWDTLTSYLDCIELLIFHPRRCLYSGLLKLGNWLATSVWRWQPSISKATRRE
jgi:hypothetical protein